MPQAVEENKKLKSKGLKALIIVVAVIAAIAVIAALFIHITTMPKSEEDENAIYIGGMITSDTVDYQSEAAEGLDKNAVVKIMQMFWRFCDSGDKKKHAAQTPDRKSVV